MTRTDLHYTNLPAFGLIPRWLSPHSTTPLWQQIDEQYAYGGGWRDFKGFAVAGGGDEPYSITYPDDPTYHERGRITIGGQTLAAFPHSWFLWTDGTDTKIARID